MNPAHKKSYTSQFRSMAVNASQYLSMPHWFSWVSPLIPMGTNVVLIDIERYWKEFARHWSVLIFIDRYWDQEFAILMAIDQHWSALDNDRKSLGLYFQQIWYQISPGACKLLSDVEQRLCQSWSIGIKEGKEAILCYMKNIS